MLFENGTVCFSGIDTNTESLAYRCSNTSSFEHHGVFQHLIYQNTSVGTSMPQATNNPTSGGLGRKIPMICDSFAASSRYLHIAIGFCTFCAKSGDSLKELSGSLRNRRFTVRSAYLRWLLRNLPKWADKQTRKQK